ncbi:hypothetical protein [Calothrix sp. UHCC 0171]|nr:hypothetical protein [Calothrix sp. UHCC 0171]MEA5573073.1 hypothetical protein [Calothrix sp. UHCC 0171]
MSASILVVSSSAHLNDHFINFLRVSLSPHHRVGFVVIISVTRCG